MYSMALQQWKLSVFTACETEGMCSADGCYRSWKHTLPTCTSLTGLLLCKNWPPDFVQTYHHPLYIFYPVDSCCSLGKCWMTCLSKTNMSKFNCMQLQRTAFFLFFSLPVILVWPCRLPGGPRLAFFTFTALWQMHLHYWDFNPLPLSWDKSRKWALQAAHKKNPQKKLRCKISVRGAFGCCLKSIWTNTAGSVGRFIRNGTKNKKKEKSIKGFFSVTKQN